MFSIRNNTYFYRNYFDVCSIEGVVKIMLYKKEMIENIESLREKNKKLNRENKRLNNKYNKALEILIDYSPCEVDDFMNVHSDYCETHCEVDEEQYKRCWNKFIEWKLGSDKE